MNPISKILCALAMVLATHKLASGQELRITSPQDGAVATPGDQIVIVIDSQGQQLRSLAVTAVGAMAISEGDVSGHSPYAVPFVLPLGKMGPLRITAVGDTVGGLPVQSQVVTLSASAPSNPVSLRVVPSVLDDLVPGGEPDTLRVEATFPDGRIIPITKAPGVSYTTASGSGSVVTVTDVGEITPQSAGHDSVHISFAGLSIDVPVTVSPK